MAAIRPLTILPRAFGLPDFSKRSVRSELMDDPALDENALYETLRSFEAVNRIISRTHALIRKTIFRDIERRKVTAVTLLDIGAGGCEVGRWFARECRDRGIACRVYCLDADPRAVKFGRETCKDYPNVTVMEFDALKLADLTFPVDYIFSNHFLHHLDSSGVRSVMELVGTCAKRGFVMQDLHRHVLWYLGFSAVAGVLWRRGWTFADGQVSIKRGFTRGELLQLCAQAGVRCSVKPSAPGHFCLTNLAA